MQHYQQQVVKQQVDLDKKIVQLDFFISGSIFTSLHADEQNRLKLQAEAMQEYSDILGERIEEFE